MLDMSLSAYRARLFLSFSEELTRESRYLMSGTPPRFDRRERKGGWLSTLYVRTLVFLSLMTSPMSLHSTSTRSNEVCARETVFDSRALSEQSNKRSGTRMKTESETGERRFAHVRLLRHASPISLLILRKKTTTTTVLQSTLHLRDRRGAASLHYRNHSWYVWTEKPILYGFCVGGKALR